MKQNFHTAQEIADRLRTADAEEFAVLERSLAADTRKTVRRAVEATRRRLAAEAAEAERLERLYAFQDEIAGGKLAVGLDEVGRGPLAGPVSVGAVVLPPKPHIAGLNDSKQLSPERREEIAVQIKQAALAWTVVHVEPKLIDEKGIVACLKHAFGQAVAEIEAAGIVPEVVLLDGNPLHFDPREVNIVKGDARCASISAASIVAKVERDALMCELDRAYPGYGFAHNKGYGSADHIAAIKEMGLSPVHRVSFCTAFTQDSLF